MQTNWTNCDVQICLPPSFTVSANLPFGPAQNLGPEVNTAGHEGGAALSSDGLTLLFHRYSTEPNGGLSHWQATRKSANDMLGSLRPLVVPGLIESIGAGLSLSAPADTLYCSTNRPGGSPDIAVSHRVRKPAEPR